MCGLYICVFFRRHIFLLLLFYKMYRRYISNGSTDTSKNRHTHAHTYQYMHSRRRYSRARQYMRCPWARIKDDGCEEQLHANNESTPTINRVKKSSTQFRKFDEIERGRENGRASSEPVHNSSNRESFFFFGSLDSMTLHRWAPAQYIQFNWNAQSPHWDSFAIFASLAHMHTLTNETHSTFAALANYLV